MPNLLITNRPRLAEIAPFLSDSHNRHSKATTKRHITRHFNDSKAPCRVHRFGSWVWGQWNGGVGWRRECRRCGWEQTK